MSIYSCVDIRMMCNFLGCTESFFLKVDLLIYLTDHHNLHRALDKNDYYAKRNVNHGSVKTNSFCPGHMVSKVNLESDSVELTYFRSRKYPITLENTVSDMKRKVNYKRRLYPDIALPHF